MDINNTHVAVVGAGVVGVSCALWLQSTGFKVTLIDGNEPGAGASSGNACTIADYGCVPINHPDLIKQLPALLMAKRSPLTINPIYALSHLRWMLDFLRHCNATKVAKIVTALASILQQTNAGLDPLISLTQTEKLLVKSGCVYVYENKNSFEKGLLGHQIRAENGFEFDQISRDELYDLEPNLLPIFQHGALFGDARRVVNPQELVSKFFQHFLNNGGKYVNSYASGIVHNSAGMQIFLANKPFIRANKIVISAGACSAQIKGCDSEKLPLDTERGYHIQYNGAQNLTNRAVAWADNGFYAVPTDQGLRFAGTVEIAGLSEKRNQRHIDFLAEKSKQMFKINQPHTTEWMGYRPTLPDSLPVIGQAKKSPNTYYAFGHQHLGLTLAGITGKLISELIAEKNLSIDISPFSADRFNRKIA